MKPQTKLTLVQWSDKHRQLSRQSSAEPGRWKTERVEVARGPMLAVTDPEVKKITVMSCTQLMKTELINNIVGFFVHQDPCPMIVMQPTVKLGEAWSKDRLDKMIQDTKVLTKSFGHKKSGEQSNTILHKEFDGGHITVVGANAPGDLAMRPVRIVLCDEVDKYPASAGDEGDPIKLVAERTATFWNALLVQVCSPTTEGRSRIALEFEQSDQRKYFVDCQHCGEEQLMEWRNVKWPEKEPLKAAYHCDHCAKPWTEPERLRSIQGGRWKATEEFTGHAGFQVSKLCSPWETMGRLAEKFVQAKESPELLKTFVNTQLAETWKDKGEAPDWKKLYMRRENYKAGFVPKGVLFLTCGVDVQDNRLEAQIVGWGEDKQSWLVDYRVLHGSTSESEVWSQLTGLLGEHWSTVQGVEMPIQVMAVDSGFNTQTVYNYCRKFPANRVIACKGSDSQRTTINSGQAVDVKKGGVTHRRAYKVFTVGVDLLKQELYGVLRMDPPEGEDQDFPPGFFHFPEMPEEYFRQLTAEVLVKKVVRGFTKFQWEKTRERNEALDTWILARAAASFFGLDRFKGNNWDFLKNQFVQEPVKTVEKAQKKVTMKRRKSNFL